MALNTGVSSLGCGTSVQWSTELPGQNNCVRMNLSIGNNNSWYLCFVSIGEWYELYLYNDSQQQTLERPYKVTTYIQNCSQAITPFLSSVRTIQDCSRAPFLSSVRTVSKSGDFLLRTRSSDLTKYTGNNTRKTIFCLFQIEPKANVSTQTDLFPILSPTASRDLQHLSRDFGSFMKDETFSDVKLKCGDCTFSAHKSVLAARSEVFDAMFRNKMAESETGIVGIHDLEPEVLEELLKYMYSGESPDVCLSIAQRLYQASDKYAVYALKKTCSEYMVEDLTEENCLELLVLADQHTDEDFKEAVSHFVAKHLQSFSRERWSRFKKENPELAVAVLEKLCATSLNVLT